MLHLLTVRFPSNIEAVRFTNNYFSGASYDYLSPVPQKIGQLVVVPVYSRSEKLRLAEVVDCVQMDDADYVRIGRLRYVIDVVDTDAFESFEQQRLDRVRALRILEEANAKLRHEDIFARVGPTLPEEQREFVRRALQLPASLAVARDAETGDTPTARALHDAGDASAP